MKYFFKIIEYGLYLVVFLLPLQTRWIIKAGFNEYQTYSLYGVDILLILVLLLFIVSKMASFTLVTAGEKHPNNRMICWFLGGFLLISGISGLLAANKLLALYKFSWLILGVGLFWLIANVNYEKLKLIYAILAGIFLQAILGIWQFFSQSSFSNKWLGLATHDPAQLGTSVVEFVARDGIGERWLRSYGGLDHPNMLGGILAIGILLLIGQMVARQIFNVKFFKIINWIFLAVFSVALFFSFSRGAWLAVLAGGFFMLTSFVIRRDLKSQKEMLTAILFSSILIGVLFFQYNELVITRLTDNSRLEIKSKVERVASYHEATGMIKKYPITGVGLGNYTLALNRQIPNQESFYYQPTHNVFLLIWAETGVFGLLFFIGLMVYLLAKCFTARNNAVVASLIVLIILMSIDHWLFSLHFGVLFFWLILGIAENEKGKSLKFNNVV
ncbi:MAG: O-antigen ligase family protein [Patescibacteria group bacterium]|jgi:O-antigen ligase